jgi:hypothetical protein
MLFRLLTEASLLVFQKIQYLDSFQMMPKLNFTAEENRPQNNAI